MSYVFLSQNCGFFKAGDFFAPNFSRVLPSPTDRKMSQEDLMTTIKRFLRFPQHSSKLPAYKTFSATNKAFMISNAGWTAKQRENIIFIKADFIKLGKSKKPTANFACFSCPNRKFEQKRMFAKKKARLPRIVNFMCFVAFPPLYNGGFKSLFNTHDNSYCTFSA